MKKISAKPNAVYCQIHSITHDFKPIKGEDLLFELNKKNGHYFLKYRIDEESTRCSFEETFVKFKFSCVGLSVATLGHFWVKEELFSSDDEYKSIWSGDKSIKLVVDKEILSSGKKTITARDILIGEDLTTWISLNYPRVFTYYTTALFLLRSSAPIEYLYADILLNFFKIIELITYKRTNKKPELDVIIEDSKSLKIINVDENDMRQFYIVRSRDAAHDYDKAQEITRKQAVECKLWVDELIIKDLINRSEKPRLIAEVRETESGAIITPIVKGD
ncbi:MAG: hypothetical protein L6N96_03000 [Candidatus Methylarchaceae archaeon HK02M2]|nr:hypothetical protein [Candidatus Methylarchaceae archaeon HK02M2]